MTKVPKNREEYRSLHCRCPLCGEDGIETTCIGSIVSDWTTYRDRNYARCKCGWKGRAHDLVAADTKGDSLE